MANLLVVEDERDLASVLVRHLETEGHRVLCVHDGRAALAHAATEPFDLVILDLMLPGLDGLEVARRVRAAGPTPILMLTARADEADRVTGLEAGADDYLTKPFGMGELLARLRVVLRRRRGPAPPRLHMGDVTIDLERRLVYRGGAEVHLTPTEMSLLLALAREAGKVLTHRQILHRVWGGYAAENAPQLRVYINYLRRKLEDDPAHPRLIVTEPGVGYRLKTEMAIETPAKL